MFLKPFLAHHPDWSFTGPHVGVATVAKNVLGMRVVVRPTNASSGVDLWDKHIGTAGVEASRAIPISTDAVWQVASLMRGPYSPFRVSDCAARSLNAKGLLRATLSVR